MSTHDQPAETQPACLVGGGEAGVILRDISWADSPLGPVSGWSAELQAVVKAVLASDGPALVHWGPQQVCFYNDAYAPEMGARHPQALGRPARAWIAELREARTQLQQTLSNSEIIGLWNWHIKDDRVIADRRFAELYGVDPARAASGAPIAEFLSGVHPDDRDRLGAAIDQAVKAKTPFASEYRLQGQDGAVRYVLARGQASYDEAGKPVRLAGATIDITEQRLAELKQRESEERYVTLFNSIEVGFCILEVSFDAEGKAEDYRFLEVNPAFEKHTGLVGAQGRSAREMVPELEQYWFDTYGHVAVTGESLRFSNYADSMEGRWFDVHAQKVGGANERRVALIFSDVTDSKRAELKLRASESQFRLFAQAMPNPVWTSPPDGQLDWFNDRVYAYSGLALGKLDGGGWTQMVHPDDIAAAGARWAEALASGDVYETEFRLRRVDGEYRWHIARAVPIKTDTGEVTRWIGTNTDIEDQKTAVAALAGLNATLESRVEARTQELMVAEEQLRQAQKMEAIGQLTGGIAHDFNNLMTGIISAMSLVRRRIDRGQLGEVPALMDAASASAHRAAALTHRLLAYARRQSLDVKAADIGALVAGMRDLLNQTLGENIKLRVEAESPLWLALTDAHQLENAVLNLAINARDAMPGGGRMVLAMKNRALNTDEAQTLDLAPGDYVELSLADTGAGMPPEVLAKVFDPFFTTKPIGQGTGLGLSMVYGFARQSGGHVKIDSTVGVGTRVALLLPRAQAAEAAKLEGDAENAPHGAGETVLVVEDDATVRLVVTAALAEWGYRSIVAPDAHAAIPIIESDTRIDLLLTDVGLPSINGRQLADIARHNRPDLRILFMTGYAEEAALRGQFLGPGMGLVSKPFALDVLGTRIHELIQR